MNGIFNYDNKFFQVVNKIIDCFFISMLWLIFSLPIITIGASSTATYYTVNKVLKNKRGYVWQSFWSSFKSNFKQATIIWLICFVAGIMLFLDAYITREMLLNTEKLGFLYYVFLVMIVLLFLWMVYLFSYIARFENTTKQIMKNSALIAIANLPKTFLIFVEILAGLLIAYVVPYICLFMPALLCWTVNLLIEKIYQKYMSPEDIEREKELEMEANR